MTETTTPPREIDSRHGLRRRTAWAGLALLCAAILAACGGGGGGGGGDGGGGGGGGNTPHAIGGRVDGLNASGLVLQNNGGNNLSIGAAGSFRFTQTVAHGGAYAVTVFTQPQGQACAVAHGSGTANDEVSNIVVTCSTTPPPPPPQTQTVGGSISGLTSAGLVLRNNGGDGITIAADATSFTFPTAVARGAGYAVSIGTQPQGNDCTVANGSGSIAEANVTNVQVSCGPVGPLTLVSSNPAHNATGVARDVVPTLTFSAPLNADTAGAAGRLMIGAGADYVAVAAEPVVQGAQLGMRTPGKLLPGARYAIDARASQLRGARGEPLAGPAGSLFTTADAAWGATQLFGATRRSVEPDAGMASNSVGDAVVTWLREAPEAGSVRVLVRTYGAASGLWSAEEDLGDANALDVPPVVAISDRGAIAVMWWDGARLKARHRTTAGGGWSAPVNVVSDPGRVLSIVMLAQADGVLHLLWSNSGQVHIVSGRVDVAEGWQEPRIVGLADTTAAMSITDRLQAVALPTGGAMVVWEEVGEVSRFYGVVRARRVDAGGVPMGAEPVNVSALGANRAALPALAVQQEGNETVVHVGWRWAGNEEDRAMLRRWFLSTDSWEHSATDIARLTVSTLPHADGRMSAPSAAAPVGAWSAPRTGQLAWGERRLSDGRYRLRGLPLRTTGTPEAAASLLEVPGVGPAQSPGVAPLVNVDRAGNALVVYEHQVDGAGGTPNQPAVELRSVRRLAQATQWSAPGLVARPQVTSNRLVAQLVGSHHDTGGSLVLWREYRSDVDVRLQVRHFD